MHYEIQPNPRHETFTRTAFLEQIAAYEPVRVTLVATRADLLDQNEPPSLENLGIPIHHLKKLDSVVFQDAGKSALKVLHERK